jgi:DNA-binding IclR family transcriptional regulator
VIGRVTALGSDAGENPLLFFQGGYGGFRSRSRVVPFESDLRTQLQYADIARGAMERLSDDVNFECFAQARVDDQLIVVAGVGGKDGLRTQIGRKLPFVPPHGAVFVANNPEMKLPSDWSNLLQRFPEADNEYQGMLQRVRERGWSVVLNAPANEQVWAAIHEHISIAPTADTLKKISGLVSNIIPSYEPEEIRQSAIYNPRLIVAPVYKGEQVVLSISLFGIEQGVSGAQVIEWAERLKLTATEISKAISRETL